jgi:hypothetical protein
MGMSDSDKPIITTQSSTMLPLPGRWADNIHQIETSRNVWLVAVVVILQCRLDNIYFEEFITKVHACLKWHFDLVPGKHSSMHYQYYRNCIDNERFLKQFFKINNKIKVFLTNKQI